MSVKINEPVPGYFVITNYNPQPVLTANGWLVPSSECSIPAEIPNEVLEEVIARRKTKGENPVLAASEPAPEPESEPEPEPEPEPHKRGPGRPRKEDE
jgi:hypothetical protein